jgi:hypothetical protein
MSITLMQSFACVILFRWLWQHITHLFRLRKDMSKVSPTLLVLTCWMLYVHWFSMTKWLNSLLPHRESSSYTGLELKRWKVPKCREVKFIDRGRYLFSFHIPLWILYQQIHCALFAVLQIILNIFLVTVLVEKRWTKK